MIVEQKVSILCPLCGVKFTPQSANICPACTLSSLDDGPLLSAGDEQLFCTYCLRYERPPWINCQRESAELLAILLKKIKGLNKLQLKDAKFIWTEPHSKRIRVKVEYVRVVNQKTRVQQNEVVEFVEKYSQCPDCKKNFTPHDWQTLVQVRQHATHKRTLIALEQNLARQKWTDKALRVQTAEGGFDMYFRHQQDAHGCLTYIRNHLPVNYKVSSQLVSHNERDNTTNSKTTHALIIPSICKDDLLLMHPKWTKPLGNCSTLLLCTKVTSQLYFLDPTCNRRLTITPTHFAALEPYADIYQLKNLKRTYMILDNQGIRSQESSNQFATWGLVVLLEDQMKEIFIRSHINAQVGQQYEGYCTEQWGYIKNMPSHILVKRIITEDQKAKKKARKDLKRKQQRNQKKKSKLEQSQSVSNIAEQETVKSQGEGQWVDIEDEEDL